MPWCMTGPSGKMPRTEAWVESLPSFLWAPIPHFFFACLANTLFLAIFFRRLGNFVAGFLGVLFSVMASSPS